MKKVSEEVVEMEVGDARDTGEVNKSGEVRETGEVSASGEVRETGEVSESGMVRETDEVNELGEVRETGELKEAGEVKETGEVRKTGEVEDYSMEGSAEVSDGAGEALGCVTEKTGGASSVSEQPAGVSVALGWRTVTRSSK